MLPKYKFRSSVIQNDTVVRSYDDLIDVRCNDGYIVFVKNDGVSGEIYLPLPGDRITVDGEEITDDKSCQ